MDDQGKRVLRSFPNHPGASWERFEGRDRRQIYNVAESIQKQLIIRIYHMRRVMVAPQVQEHMIDVCILKVCDDLIAKSPDNPMRAFTREYLQLTTTIAEALYELGYDRRGNNWDDSRLWNRMQQPWTIPSLLRGHERRAQRIREKLDGYDVRECKRIAELPVSGYYLAAIDTPGALVGEGMIADNCAADYIEKPASRIYAVRREWSDATLTTEERIRFLHDLCIFTDKNGKHARKTAGLACMLRATAQLSGETLSLSDSLKTARTFAVPKIQTLVASVGELLKHGEHIPLEVDMSVASLEVQRRSESTHMLMQALGPRNVPILPTSTQYPVVLHGLAALKRIYRTDEQSQLSMTLSGIFAGDTTDTRVGTCITATGTVDSTHLVAHLRAYPEAEVLNGSYGVTPEVSVDDLRFLQQRGVPLNLEHATPAQKTALKA